jgi:hypothetical protein
MFGLRIPNSDSKLKPAIRVKISSVKQGSNPFGNGNADFTGCAENEININLGDYTGDLSQAKETIQAFCNQNEVTYTGLGIGYATLTVNGQPRELTPYHIDIKMILDIVAKHSPAKRQEQSSSYAQGPQLRAFELQQQNTSVNQRKPILEALENITKSILSTKWRYSNEASTFWLRCPAETVAALKDALAAYDTPYTVNKVLQSTDHCIQIKNVDLQNSDQLTLKEAKNHGKERVACTK